MCIVSFIGDNYRDTFPQRWPQVPSTVTYAIPEITRAEFEALKREVEALKELLREAKKFDEATGQPDCEMEQKVKFLREIADALGIYLDDVLPAKR